MTKSCLLAIVLVCACLPAEHKFERSAPFRPGVHKIHVADDRPLQNYEAIPSSDAETIYISPTPVLTEAHLQKIAVWRGEGETRILLLRFTDEGSARLARVSAENVGKRLAFLVNGKVISAPVLQTEISGGEAVIEGDFTEQEAKQLVVVRSALHRQD